MDLPQHRKEQPHNDNNNSSPPNWRSHYHLIPRNKEEKQREAHLLPNIRNRNIIDSIKALEKEITTETNIATKYREITGRDIDLERLQDKLMEAEESNIIKRKITNINDEPYITWKLTFNKNY